jgi:hypothetical protein
MIEVQNWSVASRGPEFNPQYCQNQKKRIQIHGSFILDHSSRGWKVQEHGTGLCLVLDEDLVFLQLMAESERKWIQVEEESGLNNHQY